ncbi:MAG: hypothetical protein ABIJ59_11145 [Pseudomonadota bacterium]
MDAKFLEFYGRFLLNAAQSQKQFEKLSDWLNKGFKGFEGMEDVFKNCYGITGFQTDSSNENEKINEAMDAFRSSFSSYVRQMGWVPVSDYEKLKKKYENLQSKIDRQQKNIDQLNTLLGIRSDMDPKDFFTKIQKMGEKQNEQFKN